MRDWNWTEPSDEEFEKLRRDKTFYRLFKVDDVDERYPRSSAKTTLYKFWAVTYDEALATLDAYKEDHPGVECYVGTSGYVVREINGRQVRCDDMFERSEYEKIRDKPEDEEDAGKNGLAEIRQIFKEESDKFVAALKERMAPSKNKYEDVHCFSTIPDDIEFLLSHYDCDSRTTHARSEYWSVDNHVLGDIVFNADMLIRHSHGYPNVYTKLAADKLGIAFDENNPSFSFKDEQERLTVENKAVELWNEELADLIKLVKTYRYYSDFGIIDGKDEESLKLEAELKPTLPYKKGSFYEFDYARLAELADDYWNRVFDKFKKIGRSMWD